MIDNPDLDAFYRVARIVLWVEDAMTRDYLYYVCGESRDIHCYIAGGNEKISALVKDAREMGLTHVFGVLDRDFGRSNRSRWPERSCENLKLPRHEIENYLLDADALTGVPQSNRERTRQEVTARLQELAEAQPAWLACSATVQYARSSLLGTVSTVSIQTVRDLDTARKFLREDAWVVEAANRASGVTLAHLEQHLEAGYQRYQTAVSSGNWFEDIDDKTVFRHISEFVYRPASIPAGSRSPSSVVDSDLAKAVGAWQRENNRVPPDIADLLAMLRGRVAA